MRRRKLKAVVLAALLLPVDAIVAALLLLAYLISLPLRLFRRPPPALPPPNRDAVTIQILNWDGRHLLSESLPALIKAVQASGGQHEIVVVDNGSTDGSVAFIQKEFPQVRVIPLKRNYGFAIGNNLGIKKTNSDIVVFLNNDMLVDENFLAPLLAPFTDPGVFAVTSQIFFADSTKRREETGKTRGRFERGFFYLWHDDIDGKDEAQSATPVLWAGGGSCAVDRRKFELIGGFDSLYHPFYVEDADLSYQAWKRGWKSLLAPASRVIHKHRGTSRPKFGDEFVDAIIRRNQYLLVWKNVNDFRFLWAHIVGLPRIHGRAMLERGPGFETRAFLRAALRMPFAIWRRMANIPDYLFGDADVMKFAQ